jgi:hypothetical protein
MKSFQFIFLLILIFPIGCISYESKESLLTQGLSLPTTTSPENIVAQTTSVPVRISTVTRTPSPTNIQRLTRTLPVTLPPPTYTLGPTFSPAEEEAYWIDLISDPAGCELPCWWGITPGKSVEKDLLVLYKPSGLQELYPWPTSDTLETQEYPISVNRYNFLNLALTVFLKSGIVQRLSISAENLSILEDNADSPYWEAMRRYSLDNVLFRHGIPSRVLLSVDIGPFEEGAPRMYALWLFYDQQGILIFYEGEGQTRIGDIIRVCPSYEKLHDIAFYLQSPESGVPLEDIFDGGLNSESLEYTLENTTSLRLEDFYNKFVHPEPQACLETPVEVWIPR